MHVTRLADAPTYKAALHHGVTTLRLQGLEAGPTDRFWVGLSYYEPGGGADESPTQEETVYVVLEGELTVIADSEVVSLGPRDSVHLTKGIVRSIENRTVARATLLVIIALAREAS